MSPKQMTIEEIREQCEALSNEELFLVINNKQRYNERIVRVAYEEIRNRRLSREEVNEIEHAQRRCKKIITGDFQTDILLLEKVGFFVFCIPWFLNLVIRDYRKRGYILKTRQALYFKLSGLFFFLSSFYIGKYFHSLMIGSITWLSGFLLAYFSNQYYFKEKIRHYLEARSVDTEAEEGK